MDGPSRLRLPTRPALWTRPEADGVITADPSVALVVRVADCAPVLLADKRTGVAAAVHAGWRSTMQRIVPAAVEALANHGTDPMDLVAAIGPSLGTCCGEMGEEVVDAFRAAGHSESTLSRWFVRRARETPTLRSLARQSRAARGSRRPRRLDPRSGTVHAHLSRGFPLLPGSGRESRAMAAVIRRR